MDRDLYYALNVINNKLNLIIKQSSLIIKIVGEDVMAGLDEINEAVGRLETSADAIIAKLEALKASGTVDPAAAQAVIDRINAVGAKLDAVSAEPAA